jgi:hypothetical protein
MNAMDSSFCFIKSARFARGAARSLTLRPRPDHYLA